MNTAQWVLLRRAEVCVGGGGAGPGQPDNCCSWFLQEFIMNKFVSVLFDLIEHFDSAPQEGLGQSSVNAGD